MHPIELMQLGIKHPGCIFTSTHGCLHIIDMVLALAHVIDLVASFSNSVSQQAIESRPCLEKAHVTVLVTEVAAHLLGQLGQFSIVWAQLQLRIGCIPLSRGGAVSS